jgi:SPP1 family predicted phage head-tail adaptor
MKIEAWMVILVFVKSLGKRVKDGQEYPQFYNMKLGKAKANYIDANTMTRQVGIYAPTRTSDGQGGYTTTFALQSTVWGDLRPDNQVREIGESELQFDQRNRLYIRYGVTILDSYEVEVEGDRYTIHSIKNVENQNRFLELIIYK